MIKSKVLFFTLFLFSLIIMKLEISSQPQEVEACPISEYIEKFTYFDGEQKFELVRVFGFPIFLDDYGDIKRWIREGRMDGYLNYYSDVSPFFILIYINKIAEHIRAGKYEWKVENIFTDRVVEVLKDKGVTDLTKEDKERMLKAAKNYVTNLSLDINKWYTSYKDDPATLEMAPVAIPLSVVLAAGEILFRETHKPLFKAFYSFYEQTFADCNYTTEPKGKCAKGTAPCEFLLLTATGCGEKDPRCDVPENVHNKFLKGMELIEKLLESVNLSNYTLDESYRIAFDNSDDNTFSFDDVMPNDLNSIITALTREVVIQLNKEGQLRRMELLSSFKLFIERLHGFVEGDKETGLRTLRDEVEEEVRAETPDEFIPTFEVNVRWIQDFRLGHIYRYINLEEQLTAEEASYQSARGELISYLRDRAAIIGKEFFKYYLYEWGSSEYLGDVWGYSMEYDFYLPLVFQQLVYVEAYAKAYEGEERPKFPSRGEIEKRIREATNEDFRKIDEDIMSFMGDYTELMPFTRPASKIIDGLKNDPWIGKI